jgi:hypothetical protein
MRRLSGSAACWVSMSGPRICTTSLFLALTLAAIGAPSYAWLYDGGTSISGPQVKDGSATVWVSQPFTLAADSWVTSFGAAVARGFGNSEMGFNVYLSDQRFDLSAPVIASGTIFPLGPGYSYYYVNLENAVRLNGGQKYYLTLAPTSNNFMGSVCFSYKPGADSGLSTGDYGQTWSAYPVSLGVRVDGNAVPEVGTWLVLLVGLVGLAGLTLLRRRSVSRAGAGLA